MVHLGLGEYALLLHLSDNGRQSMAVNGNRATVGDAHGFRLAVIDKLVGGGLVSRADLGDSASTLELSVAGRSSLDDALARKWVVDHSGLHEESGAYRFEVPDPVTGRRFVVAVAQGAGPDVAHRAAYGVIAAPSVRGSCRELTIIGPDGAFPVQVAIEGAGEIKVWRKL